MLKIKGKNMFTILTRFFSKCEQRLLSSADKFLVKTQVRVDSPDLDPNCLSLIIIRKECFEKLIKKSDDKKDEKLPSMHARIMSLTILLKIIKGPRF